MERSLFYDNFFNQFIQTRKFITALLADQKVDEVSIWGAGISGEIVFHLLNNTGIKIDSVYDSHKTGNFFSFPIKKPYQISGKIPVIIASSRKKQDLAEMIGLLESKKIEYYLTTPDQADSLKLENFEDAHVGQRCFVIGNGPSLNLLKMNKLKNEVSIGANRCFLGFKKWGFTVPYWTIEDRLVAKDVAREWNKLNGPIKFIPGDLKHLVTNTDNVCYLNFKREQFNNDLPKFSNHHCQLFWGGTVTYLMLQLAVLMGCNPIYLIGVDFHYIKPEHVTEGENRWEWTSHGDDPNHFDATYFGRNRKWHDPLLPRMRQSYVKTAQFCQKKGISIYNATPGTRLDVFQKVEFSSLF